MKSAFFAASAALLACALPAAAQKTDTLEVVSGTTSFRGVTVSFVDPIGQSFTAFSDTISSVGFQFVTFNNTANTPLSLAIYAGETLTGTALFNTTFTLPTSINNRNLPEWVDVAVPNLAVSRDQTYSLVLNATSTRAGLVVGPGYNSSSGQFFGGDAYAGGKLISAATTYANCVGANNNCDANFRVTGQTFAAAVPEPGSWALMILGFGITGSALRGSRKRRVALTYV